MKHKRKILKRYLATILVTMSVAATALGQISPGPLTKYHEKYDGLSNCTRCHVIGNQVPNYKCLACHTEIQILINENTGYHSNPQVKDKLCASCHSEHHGRNFQIIHFDPKAFNHALTGFILQGKHARLQCAECHQARFVTNALFRKHTGSYLGLDTTCTTCHTDPHQGTLGDNCASCHDENGFKPAAKFNHNDTKFALTGTHKKLECARCHVPVIRNGKPFVEYAGLNFANCVPCHKDPHNGKFGEICERCHNTVSFTLVSAETFNHNLTGYPLVGRHREVACKDCHGSNLDSRPQFRLCTDCHKDYHHGQFMVNNTVENCADCHTVFGFQLTTYTITRHNETKFALTGSHLAVSCQQCHLINKTWEFTTISTECISCHKNVHGDQLTSKFLPDDKCTACHTTETWDKVTFDHNTTSFRLSGKHATLGCKSCHFRKGAEGVEVSVFKSLNPHCETCHKDIHYGQFAVATPGVDYSPCASCHTFNNWAPVKFNHDNTSFPLTGTHAKLPCADCHKRITRDGNTFVLYRIKDFKCAACHSS